jgi:hypothetical protein
MEQALPAAMIVNFSGSDGNINANGDVVSMLITEFRKGRWLSNTLTTSVVVIFYQTKAAFFVTERVYRQLLKYYFSAFF